MKVETFKKLVKEAAIEAFREEFKSIILEAVKSNNSNNNSPVKDSPPSKKSRELYENAMNETVLSFTSKDVPKFNPQQPNIDTINGALPEGEVGFDQIQQILK